MTTARTTRLGLTIAVLEEARDLVARPGGWTTGAYAKRTDNGVAYCAVGAVNKAVAEIVGTGCDLAHVVDAADEALADAIPDDMPRSITFYNDHATQPAVVAWFNRSIATLAGIEP